MTKLDRYLAEHGITRSELSRRSGVNRRTVQHATQGRDVSGHETSLETWSRFARALGCNVYEISEDAYGQLVGTV